jgi:hypothetical protein
VLKRTQSETGGGGGGGGGDLNGDSPFARDFALQSSWDSMGAEELLLMCLNLVRASQGPVRLRVGQQDDERYATVEELIRSTLPKATRSVFVLFIFFL